MIILADPDKFENLIRNKYESSLDILLLNTLEDITATTLVLIKSKVRFTESMAAALIYQYDELKGLLISRPDFSNGTNIFKIIDSRGTIIEGIKPKFIWLLPELPRKFLWNYLGDKSNYWSFEVSVRDKVPELQRIYDTPTPINAVEIVDRDEFIAFSKGPLLLGCSVYSKNDPENPILKISEKRLIMPTKRANIEIYSDDIRPEIILSILGYAFFYSREFR